MQRRVLMWSLTGVSAALGFMLTVQLSSRPESTNSISSYLDLRTQVVEQLQEHQLLVQDISQESAQLAQFQASGGNTRAMRQALEQDANRVATAAGMTRTSGPGIVIVIRDDPNLPYYSQFAGEFNKESDQEISQIVNDLFANGATAISVDDQRLVTTSSIRLVTGLSGEGTLQINTFPVVMPYVIKAIGNVDRMKAVLKVDNVVPVLNLMQEDCIVTAHNEPLGVTVAGYDGPLPGAYAKEVAAQ